MKSQTKQVAISPFLVTQVAGLTAAWTRFWFRLFLRRTVCVEALTARLDSTQNRRILVPEPALSKLLQLGAVGEFWRTNLTDHPTQKCLKPGETVIRKKCSSKQLLHFTANPTAGLSEWKSVVALISLAGRFASGVMRCV